MIFLNSYAKSSFDKEIISCPGRKFIFEKKVMNVIFGTNFMD